MAPRSGLGKGLDALIPTGASTRDAGYHRLPISSIEPNAYQPREHFDEEALAALADSIREIGLLQPVLVRPREDGYELIAGERRWRAAKRAGLQLIPAIVREVDDASALEQALVENLHRSDLDPLEEAAAYQQLIEDFELTHDEVATRVGRSRATVTNILRLLQLPPVIQRLLRERQLSMGHARALLGTPDRAFQEHLAKRAATEGMSVREVEEAVRIRSDGVEPRPSPARAKSADPGFLELEERLGDHLNTRVKVTPSGSKGRGKIVLEYGSLEDLERIYRLIGPRQLI